MGRRWKIAWVCGIVVVFVAYLYQVYQREKMTREFLQNVQEAVSADILVGKRSTLAVPPEQFARLKELLLHVRPLRPAMGEASQASRKNSIIGPDVSIHIAFTNAEGKKLSYILALGASPDIMPESQAKELSLLRKKNYYEPHWYLPDAELAEIHSLPIIRKSFILKEKNEFAEIFFSPTIQESFKHNKENSIRDTPAAEKKEDTPNSP